MKNLRKFVAAVIATAMFFAPTNIFAVTTGNVTTPVVSANENGNQGVEVYSATLTADQAGQTFGVRVSNYTQDMNQVNLALLFDGVASSYRMAVREGSAMLFTVPAGATGFSIVASTNHTNIGAFTLSVEAMAEGVNSFSAGTFTGTATSGGHYYIIGQNPEPGNVSVSVTVSETDIISIDILEYHDTAAWFARANDSLRDSILLAQSTDVDIITSATNSSNGILEAVNAALAQAMGNEVAVALPAAAMEVAEYVSEAVEYATEVSGYEASEEGDVVTVTYAGFIGDVVVQTTFENGVVVAVEVVSHSETEAFFNMATVTIDDILASEYPFADVDTATGGTVTSNAILNAVLLAHSR